MAFPFVRNPLAIKRTKQDKLFSEYIRERDNWTCQNCQRVFPRGSGLLQNSHYMGRRFYATRFHEDNCEALCGRCHLNIGQDPYKRDQRYIAKLGKKRFERIAFIAKNNTERKTFFENDVVYKSIKEKLQALRDANS